MRKLPNKKFYIYLNIESLYAAWAAYRGTMISVSTIDSESYIRPIAYWPLGLIRKASNGDNVSLRRLEKELLLERIRYEKYSNKVSRLHCIYAWENEVDAIRCEKKWRTNENQHFDKNNLVEIEFTYSNKSKVDTQWIDEYIINEKSLNCNETDWMHSYWKGDPLNEKPHWEILLNGRGIIYGTELRTKALKEFETKYPENLGLLELSRLAAELGNDLYHISPFIIPQKTNLVEIDYCINYLNPNDNFWTELGNHISNLSSSNVNKSAISKLFNNNQNIPDLSHLKFQFDLNLLSNEGRKNFSKIISNKDNCIWNAFD